MYLRCRLFGLLRLGWDRSVDDVNRQDLRRSMFVVPSRRGRPVVLSNKVLQSLHEPSTTTTTATTATTKTSSSASTPQDLKRSLYVVPSQRGRPNVLRLNGTSDNEPRSAATKAYHDHNDDNGVERGSGVDSATKLPGASEDASNANALRRLLTRIAAAWQSIDSVMADASVGLKERAARSWLWLAVDVVDWHLRGFVSYFVDDNDNKNNFSRAHSHAHIHTYKHTRVHVESSHIYQ